MRNWYVSCAQPNLKGEYIDLCFAWEVYSGAS